MAQHIGIAACSAEGAALCYRTICTEGAPLLGAAHAHPEVSMHTPSLAQYMERIYREDWQGVGEMMLASARKLAGMGAEFVICPDNTLHQALPYVVPRSPLPWLHIADAVMAEARARGYRRIGLTGTRWLVEGPVYPEALMRPTPEERDEINRIIMDELVYGVFKPSSVQYFREIMQKMKRAGCEAVVLGCTEIPLVMNDANAGLPTLDSTRLLARAALRRSLQTASAKLQP
jgi:aspartate racemase